jgi:hypothetical protein
MNGKTVISSVGAGIVILCVCFGLFMLFATLGKGLEAHGHADMGTANTGVYNSVEDAVRELCPGNNVECKNKLREMAKGTDAGMNLPRIVIQEGGDGPVPAHWGMLDELAFAIFVRIQNHVSYRAQKNHVSYRAQKAQLRRSYEVANFFLKNMEDARKPYIEKGK